MNNATIANLGAIYLALLEHPHDAWRTTHQWVLCDLRDIIAEASGSSAEAVQTSFEERALINRNPNARGRHDYRGTSRAGEETCSTAGATMPPNPVHCSTRDGSGTACMTTADMAERAMIDAGYLQRPDAGSTPESEGFESPTDNAGFESPVRSPFVRVVPAFPIRRIAGYDLGVFAVDESAKELEFPVRKRLRRVNFHGDIEYVDDPREPEFAADGAIHFGTQSEIGYLDPNETMDDLRRRLRSTMAVPRDLLGQAKRVGLFTDPRVHTYAMDWQARIRKLFERNQFLPDDHGPTVCYGDPRERLLRAPDADSTFYRLFDRDRALHECPPGMSALEHVRARAPWRDIAPVIWANLQRYGHAPIPFNPATWTGARQ